ncbi:hypothetical protein ACROYT_G036152 [Oculina patagonica]
MPRERVAHVIKKKGQSLENTAQEETEGIKDQLRRELKTTSGNVQRLAREKVQDITEKVDEVRRSIDRFHSPAGSSQSSGVGASHFFARKSAARFDPPAETSKSFSVAAPLFESPQTIFVEMPEKTITLEVEPSDSIWHVKRLIEEKEKIPCYKQRLTFAKQQLQDRHSLVHNNIQRGSTLQLDVAGMFVFVAVQTRDTPLTLNVHPSDTIEYFKKLIYDSEGIPHDKQILTFGGKTFQDGGTLGNYNIQDHSCVYLFKGIRILVEIPTGKTITLTAKPSDTIQKTANQDKERFRLTSKFDIWWDKAPR